MTLSEAVENVRAVGGELVLDEQGAVVRGPVPPPVLEILRQHKAQVVAILKLRQVHEAMGFDATDLLMIERAILSGQVKEVVIAAGPHGRVA